MRTYATRVDVLRNGAVLTHLNATTAPKVKFDSTADIKSGLSGTFIDNPLVDYITDELQPVQIIDGAEYPCGVFDIAVCKHNYTESVNTVYIEAYDRCFKLNTVHTEEILHLDSGDGYIETINSMLVTCGIGMVVADPNTSTLATAREDWDIGTDYLTIINQLLSEINFKDIWFDENGYARLEKKSTPTTANIKHRYGAEANLIQRACTSELDVYDKPNVFICVCNNADYSSPLVATATNNNPLSSLSVLKRGRRISKLYRVDNIASQTDLETYVQELCNDSMLSSEVVTITTPNMPSHGSEDVVALEDFTVEGIFVEQSWSLTLDVGQIMTHKLRRQIIV